MTVRLQHVGLLLGERLGRQRPVAPCVALVAELDPGFPGRDLAHLGCVPWCGVDVKLAAGIIQAGPVGPGRLCAPTNSPSPRRRRIVLVLTPRRRLPDESSGARRCADRARCPASGRILRRGQPGRRRTRPWSGTTGRPGRRGRRQCSGHSGRCQGRPLVMGDDPDVEMCQSCVRAGARRRAWLGPAPGPRGPGAPSPASRERASPPRCRRAVTGGRTVAHDHRRAGCRRRDGTAGP